MMNSDNSLGFTYITTVEELQHWCAKGNYFTGAPLALDCETCVRLEYRTRKGTALDPFTGEIALIIVKERDKHPLVIDLFLLKQEPDYVKTSVPLIIHATRAADYLLGANLKFDLKFLRADLGVWFKKVFDVVIASQMISNATGSKVGRQLGHGYADICRELLNVHITGKKDQRTSDWGIGREGRTLDNEWWLEKLKYAANDVKYLFYIEDIQRPVITNPLPHTALLETNNHLTQTKSWGLGMAKSLELEMQMVPVMAQMEYNGMPVGPKMMTYYQEAVKEQLKDLGAELAEELSLEQTITDIDSGKKRVPDKVLSQLRSPAGLLRIINEALHLKKIDSTQSEILKRLGDIIDTLAKLEDANPEDLAELFVDNDEAELFEELLDLENSDLVTLSPVVKRILEFKKLTKQDGMDLRRYINQSTGKIHANYSQLGAATGRLSCIAKGQRVMVPSGWKNIEYIEPGDFVYCYADYRVPVIKPVLNAWCEGLKEVIELTWKVALPKVGTGTRTSRVSLLCTPDHKIKTTQDTWVEAQDLTTDTQVAFLYRLKSSTDKGYLYGIDGYYLKETDLIGNTGMPRQIKKDLKHHLVSINPAGKTLVYNLEVERYPNFIVGGVCVSNCSTPNLQQQSGRTTLRIDLPKENLFR
jgi:hypothetical protein